MARLREGAPARVVDVVELGRARRPIGIAEVDAAPATIGSVFTAAGSASRGEPGRSRRSRTGVEAAVGEHAGATCWRARRAAAASRAGSAQRQRRAAALSTWIVNTAWPVPGDRDEGLVLGAPPGWRGERVAVAAARARRPGRREPGAACRRGSARDRPDEALPALVAGDEAGQARRRPRSAGSLSATGACTSAKWRPILSSGAQCDGRQTASHGNRRAGAVDDREVFGEGEAEQRGARATPRAGRRGSRRSRPRRRRSSARAGVERPAEARRGAVARRSSSANAVGCSRAASRGERVERRRGVEAGAASSASPAVGLRAPRASRAGARPCRARARVRRELRVPGATRRSPGCMRNGADTARRNRTPWRDHAKAQRKGARRSGPRCSRQPEAS